MTNRDSAKQMAINRAKSRALERLRREYAGLYEAYYEEEMRIEGYQRVPRGPHDRGGKGPFVWKQASNEPSHTAYEAQKTCNGANDGTCPKHPEINVPLTVIPNSATLEE